MVVYPAHDLRDQAARRVSPVVNSMQPGWADTPVVRSSLRRYWRIVRPLLSKPEEGADWVVRLALSQRTEAQSGSF